MSTEPNGGVTYTVKELLAKLDGKLDGIIITIGQKADKHDVENLGSRVSRLEENYASIDAARNTAEEVAATLAAKEIADRSWWDRWRARVAWLLGIAVAVSAVHNSFPHVHP